MIRVSLNQIEPGMTLAVSLPHPQQPDQTLLQEGYALDENIIGQLRRFGISALWIKHPGFDFLNDQLDRGLIKRRVHLYETVKKNFESIANRTPGSFDLLVYKRAVGLLVLDLIANNKNAVWADRMMNDDTELFEHSANVAYLSLVIGMKMVSYIAKERNHVTGTVAESLANLGIGGMLHDIGKLQLPDELKTVHNVDPESDCDEYRAHAEAGYRALQGRVEATACTVILNHHQRFDGEGFPKLTSRRTESSNTQAGRDIHIFSRTVAVANTIDSLLNSRDGKRTALIKAMSGVKKLGQQGMFDPVVLETAVRAIPPFPPGDIVELSDGKRAVVTRLTNWPCRPVVRPVEGLQPTDEPEIDLSAPDAPTIALALDTPVAEFLY